MASRLELSLLVLAGALLAPSLAVSQPCKSGDASCSGTLLDPQFRLQNTELAKKTLRDEGLVQQALTEYAKAATLYEAFAEAAPKDEHAPEALLDAVVLRLGLHDQQRAEQNATQWQKRYATKSLENHAKLVVAMAESKRDAGASPRELEAYLSTNRAVVAKAQSEHQPAVDVMLGTAIAARGDLAAARPHFERAAAFEVLPLFKRLQTEAQPIADRRLAKALIGIADAHLWLADRARDEVMKLTLRKSAPDSVMKKRDAVTAAERQYAKVLAMQPVPPPIATVEAAARVARMRGQLWAQAHLAFGPETADLLLAEAKAAYKTCVDLGAKFQAQTPASAGCAKWLERHYPKEHPALAEIMPRAKWSNARFPMPRPLDEDGKEPRVSLP